MSGPKRYLVIMIDRFARTGVALLSALALSIPGISQAEDLPRHKLSAKSTQVSYDQAISCQSLYFVLGDQIEIGGESDEMSEEGEFYFELFSIWHEFTQEFYPLAFPQAHVVDLHAEAQRMFDQLNRLDSDELIAEIDTRLEVCGTLEDQELLAS